MSNIAITLENIGKKYRLGEKQPYIALRDIISNPFQKSKKKQEFWVLKDINFDIQQGDIVGIIGKNGAGKSTLLKILSRITPPTTGSVKLKGRVASLLEVGTGFSPELTGRENIFLNGSILGMTRREIRRKFDEIVNFSGVEKFIDTPVKRYSSGMYVRLAFAVAAHLESEILLVDEVLAVGDAEFQKKSLDKMNEVTKSGRTILFVSHNMSAVHSLCDKTILLENGEVKAFDQTEEVLNKYLHKPSSLKSNLLNLKDRKGEGNIKARTVEFLDKNYKRLSQLYTQKPCNIKINYSNTTGKKIKRLDFSIIFTNEIGQNITFVSNIGNKEFINLPSNGSVICNISKLGLMAGEFTVQLWIVSNKEIEDLVELPNKIEVIGKGSAKTKIHRYFPKIRGVEMENYWDVYK